jgi:hypothetical protein
MLTRKRKLQDISGGPLLSLDDMALSKRRRMSSRNRQIEFLARFITDKKKSVKKRLSNPSFKKFKKSKAIKFLLRKEHSEATQALVIFLRHGTLKNDENIIRRYTEIHQMTGVRPCSQIKIIRRWKARGFIIINLKRDGKKELLTREQVRWVTDFATLQEMSHLCL